MFNNNNKNSFLVLLLVSVLIFLIGCVAPPVCSDVEDLDQNTNTCVLNGTKILDKAKTNTHAESQYVMETDTYTETILRTNGETITKETEKTTLMVNKDTKETKTTTVSEGGTSVSYYSNNTLYFKEGDLWYKQRHDTYWDQQDRGRELEYNFLARAESISVAEDTFSGKEVYTLDFVFDESDEQFFFENVMALTMPEFKDLFPDADFNFRYLKIFVDKENLRIVGYNMSIDLLTRDTFDISVRVDMLIKTTYTDVLITLPPATLYAEFIPTSVEMEKAYCRNINPRNDVVRSAAASAILNHPGPFDIDQVLDLYEFVWDEINYISDPSRPELEVLPYPSEKTLTDKSGDCDDQAVLLASLIESIGGSTRVAVNFDCQHAWTEVYLGSLRSYALDTVEYISDQYGGESIKFWEDEYGDYWLILDPTGATIPGELYPDCVISYDGAWSQVGETYYMYSCVG